MTFSRTSLVVYNSESWKYYYIIIVRLSTFVCIRCNIHWICWDGFFSVSVVFWVILIPFWPVTDFVKCCCWTYPSELHLHVAAFTQYLYQTIFNLLTMPNLSHKPLRMGGGRGVTIEAHKFQQHTAVLPKQNKKNLKQSWLPAFWKKIAETHKRLKERFLTGWNSTKRANFRWSPLFQATYNIKTENEFNLSCVSWIKCVSLVSSMRLAEGKGPFSFR